MKLVNPKPIYNNHFKLSKKSVIKRLRLSVLKLIEIEKGKRKEIDEELNKTINEINNVLDFSVPLNLFKNLDYTLISEISKKTFVDELIIELANSDIDIKEKKD